MGVMLAYFGTIIPTIFNAKYTATMVNVVN